MSCSFKLFVVELPVRHINNKLYYINNKKKVRHLCLLLAQIRLIQKVREWEYGNTTSFRNMRSSMESSQSLLKRHMITSNIWSLYHIKRKQKSFEYKSICTWDELVQAVFVQDVILLLEVLRSFTQGPTIFIGTIILTQSLLKQWHRLFIEAFVVELHASKEGSLKI